MTPIKQTPPVAVSIARYVLIAGAGHKAGEVA